MMQLPIIRRAIQALCIFATIVQGRPAHAASPALDVRHEQIAKAPDGTPIESYTLTNARGLEVKIMSLGATLTSVAFPDRRGKSASVTLPVGSPAEHLRDKSVAGSVVGRFANRIADASFTIDGTEYALESNAGKHHIHGGSGGFQNLIWKAEPLREPTSVGVQLSLASPNAAGGYPGNLLVRVIYKVTSDNQLVIDYTATTDKPTPVNLTNHAYWNLRGDPGAGVKEHVVTINADRYLAADAQLIPTGELTSVKSTPLDFTQPATIGQRLNDLPKKLYDHCLVLNRKPGDPLSLAAKVVDPETGRAMEVWTTQPGVQFYTGDPHAFCLETQHFPDSPHRDSFPSTLLRPGQTFHEQTIHRFAIEP